MYVSKEIIELTEKIRKYRTDTKLIEKLRIKKDALENQIKELEDSLKILKLNTIEQNKLLDEIKGLEGDNKQLKLNLERLKVAYTFIITTQNEASNTVYGEISREFSNAKEEILICSPWITYIVNEFSSFTKKGGKKKINIKVITRLLKEDVEKGITDLDKFRVLKDTFGAEIRYNNDLHAKIVIVDRSVAIISSANLTKRGLSVNYEAGVCLRDADMVNKIVIFFNDMWDVSIPLTEKAIEMCLNGEEEEIPRNHYELGISYTR